MPDKPHRVILVDDVFALTAKGQSELRGAATSLAPSALEVLVLIDGKSTVDETAARARTIAKETVVNILENLLYDELIEFVKDQADALDFVDFFQTQGPTQPSVAATAKAKRETAATTLLLQQQGYFVRIARRARTTKGPEETGTLSVSAAPVPA